MHWDDRQIAWNEVCRGERCCICEVLLMRETGNQRFRYCRACVPDPAAAPHHVLINVDHWGGSYTAHVTTQNEPRFTYWMVSLTREAVDELLSRGRTPDIRRQEAQDAMRQWHRTSMHTHLDQQAYNRLLAAWRKDPRTGYEKMKGN